MRIFSVIALLVGLVASSCKGGATSDQTAEKAEAKRIVSLNGTITEVLYALDAQKELVGIDVTSTYPAQTEKIANLGHVSGVTAESVLGVKPTHVLVFEDELNPQVKQQLEKGKVEVIVFKRSFSVNGTKKVINEIAAWLGDKAAAQPLIAQIDKDLQPVKKPAKTPRVLFVYARGTGTMMVSGDKTQMAEMIALAGGTNAATGFEDFKPLTAEAVVAANPEVILMFDSGKSSLNDAGGVLAIPGVALTTAGKNKAVITMDGQLLSGFGPRVGQAIAELNNGFNKLK